MSVPDPKRTLRAFIDTIVCPPYLNVAPTYPGGFCFNPVNDEDGKINLWSGWPVKDEAGDWSLRRGVSGWRGK